MRLTKVILVALTHGAIAKHNATNFTGSVNTTLAEYVEFGEMIGKPMDRCEELQGRIKYGGLREREREWYPYHGYSMDALCDSVDENKRGSYTSHIAACVFQFHQIKIDDTEMLNEFEMSSKCTEENALSIGANTDSSKLVKDYVFAWPDECVGDFQRCYSLEYHDDALWEHLCTHNWTLPKGTTHLSVDCTKDKKLKNEQVQELKKNRAKKLEPQSASGTHDKEAMREYQQSERDRDHTRQIFFVMMLGMVLVAALVGCCCCFFIVNRMFFKPYISSMKKSRSDSELTKLVAVDDEESSGTSNRRNVVE